MKRLVFLFLTPVFVSAAQGQAFIPTATSSGGIDLWEEVQVGITMMGSQSKVSPVGGASALFLGRHTQAAYVGPTFRLAGPPVRFNLITSAGISRITSSSLPPQTERLPSQAYPFSSMVGLVFQDDARAILVGIEYSPGYELASEENRLYLRHYPPARQQRLVLGLGWSL